MDFIWDYSVSTSDILSFIGILGNIVLAVWIITVVQKTANNKRYLKEHLIGELKEVRGDYRNFMNSYFSGNLSPKEIVPWFKLMNIKVGSLFEILKNKYNINQDTFDSFISEVREVITESDEFINSYQNNRKVNPSEDTKRELMRVQQNNAQHFNNVIILINDK